jgi:hypothetical protein
VVIGAEDLIQMYGGSLLLYSFCRVASNRGIPVYVLLILNLGSFVN